ncbi:MAG: hypothetical protein U1F45_06750 [Burkholderiales bacterium]
MNLVAIRSLPPVAGVALALGAGVAVIEGGLAVARAQTPTAAAALAQEPGREGVCAMCGVVAAVRAPDARGDGRTSYRVTVRMADGSYRTLAQPTPPTVGVGDRVRIADGAVRPEK